MNRRSSPLLALVAAGCGASRTPPPATTEIAHHRSTTGTVTAPELDLDNGARMWRALAPTGANYAERLAMIPDDEELRREMAHAMLRQGDFACNAYVEEYGCSDTYFVLEPLEPSATLEDPCLRRFLAEWSLEQLDETDVVALSDVLVDLASMPSPEDVLPGAAFELATDDAMRLRLLAAAAPNVAEQWVESLETDEAKIRALVDLHLESAAYGLAVEGHEDSLRAALVDPDLSSYTRSSLLDGFVADDDPRTTRALAALTADSDCSLAMRAATLLAERGDPSRLPTRPRSHDPEAHLRALCMLSTSDDANDVWPLWIAAGGYDSTVTDSYGSYDPDTDVYTEPEPSTERMLREDAFDERAAAYGDWTCEGLTCTASEGWRNVTVTFAAAADTLVIAEIASEEYGDTEGCGC
jgi:hypothetical protein